MADERKDELQIQEHENELFTHYDSASEETQKALFVLIGPDQGIFYPPNSRVLSYDTSLGLKDPVEVRCVSDELFPGAYIIIPILKDQPEQEVLNNVEDHTSEIWKHQLRKEYCASKNQLCTILEYKGIKLENLLGCIERWSQPASNVISAPQSKEHFEKLMIFLGLNNEKGIEWCKRAWDDVRRSRGEAIQDGRIAHDEMETELACVLNHDIENLKKQLQNNESIKYKIPIWSKLVGDLHLYRITNIQDGYRVDSNELYKYRNPRKFKDGAFNSVIYGRTHATWREDVFNILAAGPNEIVSLHSLDLAPWNRGLRSEIDFVVIIPDAGIICLEVKSHENIAFDGVRWFQNPYHVPLLSRRQMEGMNFIGDLWNLCQKYALSQLFIVVSFLNLHLIYNLIFQFNHGS